MNQPKSKGLKEKMQDANQKAAVLAFATHMQEQMLPKAPPQPLQAPPVAQNQPNGVNQPQQPQMQPQDVEKVVDTKLQEFKKEIEGTIKDEIGGIKDTIEQALAEEDAKEQ